MTVDRLPARAAALLGSAMLLLAACGAEKDKTADAPAPSDAAPDTPPTSEAAAPAPAETAAATPAPKAVAAAAAAKTAVAPPLPAPVASGLAAYADSFPFDKVNGVAWNDHPAVKAGIAASVKDAKARKAIETLEGPAAPIEKRGGKLMAWACEAHNCGPHQWAVHVDPATGATDVCYFDEAASATQSRWFLASGKEERRAGNCQ
jgi:hypothetical protein